MHLRLELNVDTDCIWCFVLSETELQDLGGSIYACIDKLKQQRATVMVDFGRVKAKLGLSAL